MAKNRKFPFGYMMQNGTITTNPKEVLAVVTIFRSYLNGDTYSEKPQQTELLRSLLVGHEQLNSLDIGLLRSCVSRIWVSHFCTIEIELINGTIIHNITERSTSHGNGNECNDNSCKTADSK